MSNSFDDIPFFDEEPGEAPRKPQAPAPAGGGLAARAMAARGGGKRPDYLAGLNPEQTEAVETLVAYDVFTPPREDWINGDDAYLRAK